jgi:hypothetical protein
MAGILVVKLGEGAICASAPPPPDWVIAVMVAALKADVTELTVVKPGKLAEDAAIAPAAEYDACRRNRGRHELAELPASATARKNDFGHWVLQCRRRTSDLW